MAGPPSNHKKEGCKKCLKEKKRYTGTPGPPKPNNWPPISDARDNSLPYLPAMELFGALAETMPTSAGMYADMLLAVLGRNSPHLCEGLHKRFGLTEAETETLYSIFSKLKKNQNK